MNAGWRRQLATDSAAHYETHTPSLDSAAQPAHDAPWESVPPALKDPRALAKIVAVGAACQAGIGVMFSYTYPQAREFTACQGLSPLGRKLEGLPLTL